MFSALPHLLATTPALANERLAASGGVAELNPLYQDFYYRKTTKTR
jgi:hypothetical protein